MTPRLTRNAAVVLVLLVVSCGGSTPRVVTTPTPAVTLPSSTLAPQGSTPSPGQTAVPRFSHVVVVVLENMDAARTFEASPVLKGLLQNGVYLPQFWAEGHHSLGNYEAMLAAVEPSAAARGDCHGRTFGSCVLPAEVLTIGALMDRAGLGWKVYAEGMAGAGGACLHPNRVQHDPYGGPGSNGYATRHNPAVWFDSVLQHGTAEAYCRAHDVDLAQLWHDAAARRLPALSVVVPDTCHDGHDGSCTGDPEGSSTPAGLAAVEAWLPPYLHRLTTSPGWDAKSLVAVTFDEASSADTSGCTSCRDRSAGGRIGALLLSPLLAHPGTVSQWNGDHYGLLRTWEAAWGLPTLKSQATAAWATRVHDGDPGVLPLIGVWR